MDLKKIINPWIGRVDGYNCWCCAPGNTKGLKMEFFIAGDEVVSFLTPGKNYEGWQGVLHGGIQGTLMDEIGMWCVCAKLDTCGVTRTCTTKYIKTVYSDKPLEVHSKIKEVNRMFAIVETWITQDGQKCTEAEIKYFIVSHDAAVKDFNFKTIETED